MSIKEIGPLRAADEGLNHQIVDTFAIVSESDFACTEKIWASIARTDGSLQLDSARGQAALGPIADCSDDEHLRLLGQFCDTSMRVREGDATGYGIVESIVSGVWPDLGLTAESDHPVSYT